MYAGQRALRNSSEPRRWLFFGMRVLVVIVIVFAPVWWPPTVSPASAAGPTASPVPQANAPVQPTVAAKSSTPTQLKIGPLDPPPTAASAKAQVTNSTSAPTGSEKAKPAARTTSSASGDPTSASTSAETTTVASSATTAASSQASRTAPATAAVTSAATAISAATVVSSTPAAPNGAPNAPTSPTAAGTTNVPVATTPPATGAPAAASSPTGAPTVSTTTSPTTLAAATASSATPGPNTAAAAGGTGAGASSTPPVSATPVATLSAAVTALATAVPVVSGTAAAATTIVPTATAQATAVSGVAPAVANTPQSATAASSGSAAATAGDAETTTNNTQLSSGVAAGGTGGLTVENQHTSTIVDSSAATSRSGISVALAPTAAANTNTGGTASGVSTGVTTAASGNTSATGVLASNTVANTALAAVTIDGRNQAPVAVTSMSDAVVRDVGASSATSGAAWAVAPGAVGNPSGVATPAVARAAPTSGSVSVTGAQSQNNLADNARTDLTLSGNPAENQPIVLALDRTAQVDTRGMAVAASGPACADGSCSAFGACSTAACAAASGATQATSGAANAQGLAARNNVETHAAASVHVGGQNFAPINLIIDAVGHIFNLGIASSASGDATAGGANSWTTTTSSGMPASSGSAQATGAQVQNSVALRSSASVRVSGNNYSPIDIVLNLAANLFNWGAGFASSGDAQASGTGSPAASASSGGASATGLEVMNLVSMWADASVDVEGNNYAPIVVEIHFKTNIDNRGIAVANSGNVAAGSAQSTTSPRTAAPAAPASASGSSASAGRARGGNATAISNSVDASVSSTQLSSANGGAPLATTALTQMLRTLPPGNWNPFVDASLPDAAAPPVQPGLASTSGDTLAAGVHSGINQSNQQLAACADAGVICMARNVASLASTVRDSERNLATRDANNMPGPGGTSAQADAALVNATPTPTPLPASTTSWSGSSGNTSPGTSRSSWSGTHNSSSGWNASAGQVRAAAIDFPATGHVVLVDLWDQWPGRRLPPMPNPVDHQPTISSVDAAQNFWPGADALPLPGPQSASPPPAVGHRPAGNAIRNPVASSDGLADADEAQSVSLLAVANLDPWDAWPSLQSLPVPSQVVPRAGSVSPAAAAPVAGDGVVPIGLGLAALLASVIGARAAGRHGHHLLARLAVVPLATFVLIGLSTLPVQAQAQPAAQSTDRIDLVGLTTRQPSAESPSNQVGFQATVNYRLESVSSGFVSLFLFENTAGDSTQQSSDGIVVQRGTGQLVLNIDNTLQPDVRTLTLVAGLFKGQQKLLAWVSTNPIDMRPWPGRVAFEKAMAARLDNDFPTAESYLTQAIQEAPDTGNYYYWRGDTRIRINNFGAALTDFDRSIELQPQDRASRVGRGIAQLWLGQAQAAVDDLSTAIDASTPPDRVTAWAYRARGLARASLDKPVDAAADYQAYLDLQPDAGDRDQIQTWITELAPDDGQAAQR